MDLILIRHSAPAIDEGVCYGQTDLPLAGDAQAAAQAIAARLAALQAPLPQVLWTSPLIRCSSIAAALAARHGRREIVDARLQELDFGSWERMRWDEIDRVQLDAWAADFWHARAHGGESVAQFEARVRLWFDECLVSCESSADSHCYVVAHAGVMRAIASFALGMPLEACMKLPLAMGAVAWLQRVGLSGEWTVVHWNA
jgi:alpha-ribazole phosphatase